MMHCVDLERLIDRPVFLAQKPMDILSEVLRVVKLEGVLFFHGEFSAPWCVTTRPKTLAQYLSPDAGQVIVYHFLTEGHAYAELPDGRRVELNAGDIVVFPHGDDHDLGNGSAKAVDSLETFGANLSEGLKLARFGGGGEITKFVCGFMACERHLGDVLLSGLPPILKVSVVKEESDQWLERSIRYSVGEPHGSSAGSKLVQAKLAELLFVETIRRYINDMPEGEVGWLAGTRDSIVGRALALLHQNPSHPWTISDLARQVGLSRSRLAERFRHYLGESPMAYLARWRLKLGAEILQNTNDSVAEIAMSVGYGSEAAFNRAFKRHFDSPPAQFRRVSREGAK
jgi:AraC-like DNA-binding protein